MLRTAQFRVPTGARGLELYRIGIAGLIILAGVVALALVAAASSSGKRRLFVTTMPVYHQERAQRITRLQQMHLDAEKLDAFIEQHRQQSRESLIATGYLTKNAPQKGAALITPRFRTEQGERLLREAKDLLFGLLFGDNSSAVRFERVERELLTLTVPRMKMRSLEFMKASTELSGAGNWQDPEDIASDERADNVIIEVEYGETRNEAIGNGIVAALRLINLLEVNEQVLYARMTDIEQSTLVE